MAMRCCRVTRLVKAAFGVLVLGAFLLGLVEYFRVVHQMSVKFPPGFEIDLMSRTDLSRKGKIAALAKEEKLSVGAVFIICAEKLHPEEPARRKVCKAPAAGKRRFRAEERSKEIEEKEKVYLEQLKRIFPGRHKMSLDLSLAFKSSSGLLDPLKGSPLDWLFSALGSNGTQAFLRTGTLPFTTEEDRLRLWPGTKKKGYHRSLEKVFRQLILYTEKAKQAMEQGHYKKVGLIGGRFPWQPGRADFKECPVSACQLLPRAQDLRQLTSADAILFKGEHVHLPSYFDVEDGKEENHEGSARSDKAIRGTSPQAVREMRHRQLDQIWIYYSLESVAALRKLRSSSWPPEVFNWTATYRLDSDIPTLYGLYYPHPHKCTTLHRIDHRDDCARKTTDNVRHNSASRNFAEGKTKLAAAFVSNCEDTHRLAYIEALQRHIPVDVYGACGNLTCPKSDSRCLNQLTTDYKFYLAFENRRCREYITEKFFVNALKNNVVPVVMGGLSVDDYLKVAPPDSFIHVDDFESPAQLGNYLLKLDGNDLLYNRYFQWREEGFVSSDKFLCRLCAMLHNTQGHHEVTRKEIGDIYQWNNKEECDLVPAKFP